ncbi:MAG TPA: acetate--CoA ligase family protein [Desulfotignum sp.]|nr:acetate--CoA ligase family protein [Desulfotignum sp.]
MLTFQEKQIIEDAGPVGWVLEPAAKQLLAGRGLTIPRGVVTGSLDTARQFLVSVGGPVVIKAVSAHILHKTEHQAVVTGIVDPDILASQMTRLLSLDGCGQVLVEEMVSGIEVLVGAKNDPQFGPVVVLGLGGTSVEIFNDTAIRLAPVVALDVASMVSSLGAGPIFEGFRGRPGVNMAALTRMLTGFSHLVMDLEPFFESIDLNPVICSPDRCVAADARILLLPDRERLS